jgi:DNA-binding IclR family transcriptional regulator
MTDYPVRATRTSVRVIEALLEVREAGVTELAERLDLSKSAVHNHLVTLERVGFAVSDGGRYRLGLRFLDVGMNARDGRDLCRVAMAEVDALADQTDEMAAFVVPEFGYAVYAVTASGGRELPVHLGSRVPLHATAPGKAVLASASPSVIDEYIETHGLAALTRRTTTSAAALREELSTIGDRGLAFDRGEAFDGVRSVAAPIRSREGTAGALAVVGPGERFSGKRLEEDLPGLVLTHANDIELALSE